MIAARMEQVLCEYCGKSFNKANYGRWHGDNCKEKNGKNSVR